MVEFTEDVKTKEDHFFVREDPARIYRGIKDILVEEFSMDRIEEGKNEFDVTGPKDKIKLHAFKEKSPHTVIHYDLQWRVTSPDDLYARPREDGILKARVKTSAEVITVYPGGEQLSWYPMPFREETHDNWGAARLGSSDSKDFHDTKFYKVIVGVWYNKFYSKEIDKYEEEAEASLVHIHDLMRQKFGVEKSINRTGASQYQEPWR